MWTCPRCGRTFAARNQTHTCAPLGDVESHFARSEPRVRAAYEAALAVVRALGPVDVLAERTRIAWHVRVPVRVIVRLSGLVRAMRVTVRMAAHGKALRLSLGRVRAYAARRVRIASITAR